MRLFKVTGVSSYFKRVWCSGSTRVFKTLSGGSIPSVRVKRPVQFFDTSSRWQVLFQDPATPVMEGIIEFHHDVMFLLVFIVFFVLYMLAAAVTSFSGGSGSRNVFSHNTLLEVV